MKMKKSIALLVSLILVLSVTIGVSLAYLVATSGPVDNTFSPSRVTTEVNETFDGKVKTNVSIKNTGDTTAYIRAAVVVTWQDGNGNVYGTVPVKDTDYKISYNLGDPANPEGKWILGSDGFYYWTNPVKSEEEDANNCNTGILITEAKPLEAAPADGYTLCIEILGSGIQSLPTSVVTSEWSTGVSSVSGTTLQIKEG